MRFLFLLACLLMNAAQAAERPNILLLIGDNWSWPHAASLGETAVKTPVFDRVAREGVVFNHVFCPVPSCSPTRSSILTGRAAHQLADAASLWSRWPAQFKVFPDVLRDSGYAIGFTGKGWSPGNHKDHGRAENPAGPQFKSFDEFLGARDAAQPFFFWLGSVHTALHQWRAGAGKEHGIHPAKVRLPPCLPDAPAVREEMADYLAAAEKMDAAFGEAVAALERGGLLESTLVIITSDNGWQMPRGLANCHDTGCRVPFAARWGGRLPAGRRVDDFISLTDLAPTFLELAGLRPLPEMTGRSFADLLMGKTSATPRDHVFIERERHANVRRGDLSYPIRGIRTADYLYLRNLRPDRWPAGDPQVYHAVGDYGDIDGSRTKQFMLDHRDEPAVRPLFELCFEKRPAEELYDLRADPGQMRNLAARPELAAVKAKLGARIDAWMKETGDPRTNPAYDGWDRFPYFGGRAKEKKPAAK